MHMPRWILTPVAALVVLFNVAPASGQMVAANATITRVVGTVEARLGGPTAAWTPAKPGAQLAERDEIRALAASSAELRLPDGSILVLSENSRFIVSRLRADRQNQARSSIFHLTTGKLRAVVARAALQLVQLRQSTFAISTPAAVAAVRGTDMAVTYTNPMRMACRSGSCCCIAAATGIGIVVGDGFTATSGDGFVCSVPQSMSSGDVRFFYGTTNPAGVLHPMMTLPATLIDPTLVESWGCDEPAAKTTENQNPRRGDDFQGSISPFTAGSSLPGH